MTLDKAIRELRLDIKIFVDRANRTLKRYENYEPNLDQSHFWSELQSTVQHAEDTLEEVPQ